MCFYYLCNFAADLFVYSRVTNIKNIIALCIILEHY